MSNYRLCDAVVPYRSGDSCIVVRCIWNGTGFMTSLNSHMSYNSLYTEVRARFNFHRDDVVQLQYSLPGCAVCFLHNESDFQMLFMGAKVYDVKCVEIIVSKENLSCSTSSIRSANDSCSAIEDDDFLGEAFRSEPAKTFLSDVWLSYIKCVGQKFTGGIEEFRDKLRKYAIGHGFLYEFRRNDGVRAHAVCAKFGSAEGCSWFVNGSVASCNGFFYIHEINNVHTCRSVCRTQMHPYLNSDIVMSCVISDIMYKSSIRGKEIMRIFKSSYGFDITYKVAVKAKQKAKDKLYGSDAESFNKLSWYRDAVISTNPGSYFDLECDPSTNRFKRLFVAYGGCIEGFRYCLPVLYVDGTFGKSLYKGQILAATGRNGNKGMFPLAMCVCDSETEDNWNYFFSKLKDVIEPQGRVITFISDRGVGLLSAFGKIFPGYPHLYCYKHLTFNLAKRYSGRGNSVIMDKIRACFFKVAYSSTEKEYHFNLKLLREEGGVETINSFLSEIPVEHWCRAFFKGCRFGIMANGIAESFNNWISYERLMPVYSFLDQTRVKIMELNGERSVDAEGWVTRLTPNIEDKLKEEKDKGRKFNVHYSSPGLYEVRSQFAYTVDLNEHTCSCVKWEINCFPCPHALAAIQKSHVGDVYQYIDFYFHVETYKKCYSFPLYPISNVDESTTITCSSYIFPPIAKRPPGRRRTKRMKSGGEYPKKLITCGRCGQKGNHNRSTCTEAINN